MLLGRHFLCQEIPQIVHLTVSLNKDTRSHWQHLITCLVLTNLWDLNERISFRLLLSFLLCRLCVIHRTGRSLIEESAHASFGFSVLLSFHNQVIMFGLIKSVPSDSSTHTGICRRSASSRGCRNMLIFTRGCGTVYFLSEERGTRDGPAGEILEEGHEFWTRSVVPRRIREFLISKYYRCLISFQKSWLKFHEDLQYLRLRENLLCRQWEPEIRKGVREFRSSNLSRSITKNNRRTKFLDVLELEKSHYWCPSGKRQSTSPLTTMQLTTRIMWFLVGEEIIEKTLEKRIFTNLVPSRQLRKCSIFQKIKSVKVVDAVKKK